MTPQARDYLTLGVLARPHGVRGELVLDPASDLIDRLGPGARLELVPAGKAVRLLRLRPLKDRFLLTLEGCGSREQAEALRGQAVRTRLADIGPLPEGTHFRWQLIGLEVVTEDGESIGRLSEVLETGANDVYEVERPDGSRVLLPAITSVVRQIDLEAGRLRVQLLPGLLDDG